MRDPSPTTSRLGARRRNWLRDSSITTKLASIVAINVIALLLLLWVMTLALDISAGVRAYVGGEGLWSKGQKDAVYYLSQYARSHAADDYQSYLRAIAIPLGDKQARLEMQRPEYDYAVVEAGFVQGGNAAEDVPNLILLFRRFGDISYMAEAIRIWTEADASIAQLTELADELHAGIEAGELSPAREQAILDRLALINAEVTLLEHEFSATLGDGARWIQTMLTLPLCCWHWPCGFPFGLPASFATASCGCGKGHSKSRPAGCHTAYPPLAAMNWASWPRRSIP
jgi:hypothetical protein